MRLGAIPTSDNRILSGVLLSFMAFSLFAMADATAKYLSDDYAVLQILLVGSIFAFIPTLVFLLVSEGIASAWPKQAGVCLLRGTLTALSVLAIIWSFTKLPLADGYVLAFTAPLIVAALSGWLLQEHVTKPHWFAILLGFIGVLIMLRPGFASVTIGHAAALFSALLFALSLIILRRLGNKEKAGALLITYLIAALLIYTPLNVTLWITPDSWSAWLLMASIGCLSGMGQIMLIMAFRMAPAASVAPVQYTQLIWGLIFGFFLFADTPDTAMIIGAIMVIGSGWLLLIQRDRV